MTFFLPVVQADIDTLDIICLSAQLFGIVVIAPFIVLCMTKYVAIGHSSNDQIFKMRHTSLILWIGILSLSIILFGRPITILYDLFSATSEMAQQSVAHWTVQLIHALLWFGFLIILCIKFYLLYYNQQFCLALINQTWQKEINMGITGMLCIFSNNKYCLCFFNFPTEHNIYFGFKKKLNNNKKKKQN